MKHGAGAATQEDGGSGERMDDEKDANLHISWADEPKTKGIVFVREMAIRKSRLRQRHAECNSAIQQSATLRYQGQAAANHNAPMKYSG